MTRLLETVAQVAPSRSTVLIQGESGTGKELIAKAIHLNSPRRDKQFMAINTGAVPVDLLESTLFGHVKGAFTSAIAAKKGLFEVASASPDEAFDGCPIVPIYDDTPGEFAHFLRVLLPKDSRR